MKELKWELLSSEYLLKDTWARVRKDTCVRPDGHIVSPYFVYEFPTWVTVAGITEDNKIVMVKQYRHALGEVCIETPGGCVDDTDSELEKAAAREMIEETGYIFSTYEYLGKTSANPSTNNNLMHMFLAKGGKKIKEQSLDKNEDIVVVLYTIEELKGILKEQKIMQSMHVTCLFYALHKLGEVKY